MCIVLVRVAWLAALSMSRSYRPSCLLIGRSGTSREVPASGVVNPLDSSVFFRAVYQIGIGKVVGACVFNDGHLVSLHTHH